MDRPIQGVSDFILNMKWLSEAQDPVEKRSICFKVDAFVQTHLETFKAPSSEVKEALFRSIGKWSGLEGNTKKVFERVVAQNLTQTWAGFKNLENKSVFQDFMKGVFLSGMNVAEILRQCGLENQEDLIEMVKAISLNHAHYVALHAKELAIRKEQDRIEIAKAVALQGGVAIANYIQNFEITDQEALIEIAKIAIRKAPRIFAHVRCFGIIDEGRLFTLALETSNADSPSVRNIVKKQLDALPALLGNNSKLRSYVLLYQKVRSKIGDPTIKWIESDFDLIQSVDLRKALTEVCNYRNKSLAKSLLLIGFQALRNENLYIPVYEETRNDVAHKKLLCLILANWVVLAKQELPLEDMEVFEGEIKKFSKLLEKSEFRRSFRNNFHPLKQTTLFTLVILNELMGVSSRKKIELITKVFDREDSESAIESLRLIGAIGRLEEGSLNRVDTENFLPSLKEVLKLTLFRGRYLQFQNMTEEEATSAYIKTFGVMRIPFALDTYIGSIRGLSEMEEPLQRFIRSIILGTFSNEREAVKGNPHLAEIHEYDLDNGTKTLSDWFELEQKEPVDISKSLIQEFSWREFFQNKSSEMHWSIEGVDCLPELTQYLKDESKSSNQDFKKQKIISLCIELIEGSQDMKKALNSLQSLLGSHSPALKLTNDIRLMVHNLESSSVVNETFQEEATLSRSWQDLFLCGTEVSDSCLRIDGEPKHNKCLLTYSLDGKNAIIVIKNIEGKIIARAILKLLWDEEEKKPALFLEGVYPLGCSFERTKAIKQVAISCAERLQCRVFERGQEDVSLLSFGSNCPYEYEDAISVPVAEGGEYTIEQAREVRL